MCCLYLLMWYRHFLYHMRLNILCLVAPEGRSCLIIDVLGLLERWIWLVGRNVSSKQGQIILLSSIYRLLWLKVPDVVMRLQMRYSHVLSSCYLVRFIMMDRLLDLFLQVFLCRFILGLVVGFLVALHWLYDSKEYNIMGMFGLKMDA